MNMVWKIRTSKSLIFALIVCLMLSSFGSTGMNRSYANEAETVLLEENFDNIADGQLPEGFIPNGDGTWRVENGRLIGDANASLRTGRILFGDPSWENYTIEADITFEAVLSATRWLSVMYRADDNGLNDYYQFALRQNGTSEVAYRTPSNAWNVLHSKTGTTLPLGSVHRMKVSVYGDNVRQYLDGELLFNVNSITLRDQGMAGFHVDQMKASFDNVRVTKLEAVGIALPAAMEVEALSGPHPLSASLLLSDETEFDIAPEAVEWQSSDPAVAAVIGNELFPLQAGQVQITARYEGFEAAFPVTVLPSSREAQLLEVIPQQKYAIMTVGQAPVPLTVTGKYSDLTEREISGNMNWASGDPSVVTAANGLITPAGAGTATVTGEIDGFTVTIPVKVNANPEDAQVWIDENFDDVANGTLPDGWTVLEGTASVQEGKLVLASASSVAPARVLVPIQAAIGDYIFEADMEYISAVEDSRWVSMMYRIQNNNYPYYQFAMRRGATAMNGLEFAIRNPANQWEVPVTNFYHEPLAFGESYRIKIIASDNRVRYFINDEIVIDTDLASQWSVGDIGFQANGSTVKFDNVRVTFDPEPLPPLMNPEPFLAAEPETGIVLAPTIISQAYAAAAIDQLAEQGISSQLLPVRLSEQGTLYVHGSSPSTAISTLEEALDAVKNKLIPVLLIEDLQTAQAAGALLAEKQVDDVHIVSSNPEVIQAVKSVHRKVRGAVATQEKRLNKHELAQLAKDVHKYEATVAVIPQEALTRENVHYLHARAIQVWGISESGESAVHDIIHTGVDGVITVSPEDAVTALAQYPENTVMRKPVVVAHRGLSSLYPENTMLAYRKAYEYGADVIETDVQLTKDGEIVIMHDYTVDRTTNGTGNVKDFTLEQIRQLDAGVKFGAEFTGEKVPTFREFLQEFKGKDVVLLIETKVTGLEEQMMRMIEEEQMTDQVLVQSFDLSSVQASRALNPEIGTGYLYSSAAPAAVKERLNQAYKMMHFGVMMNVRLNASYPSLTPEFIQYMHQRGMPFFNWTFRSEPDLAVFLQSGGSGVITDFPQWFTDAPIGLEWHPKPLKVKVGKQEAVRANLLTRQGKDTEVDVSLLILDGEENIRVQGNTIEGVAAGKATVMAYYTFTVAGTQWQIATEPKEVTIQP